MFGPIEKQIYEYLKLDGRLKYDLKFSLVINNL